MFDMILYYVLMAVIVAFLQFVIFNFLYELKNKTKFIFAAKLFWSMYLFNFIYTGLLGWNWEPVSFLESTLDMITGTLMVIAMFIWYGAFEPKKNVANFIVRTKVKRRIK